MNHRAKSSPIPPLVGRTLSKDGWGAEDVFVSWLQRASGPDVLGNRASVLVRDVLWSELNIDQRGLNLCMPHELQQRREANARTDQVRGEGVPKPVQVGLRHARGLPVMTKQGTQAGRCHPFTASRPFETNE